MQHGDDDAPDGGDAAVALVIGPRVPRGPITLQADGPACATFGRHGAGARTGA